MNETTMIRTRARVNARENEQSAIDTVTGTAIVAIGGISAVIGLWSVACMVGAMVANNGPLGLIGGWLGAVLGM